LKVRVLILKRRRVIKEKRRKQKPNAFNYLEFGARKEKTY